MRALMLAALVTGVLTAPVSSASAEVRLTIVDGYVTIDARDATIREILDEWARVGQTRIVNGDRVSGPPVTLQLTRVPEGEALDVLLRSVSGYLAAPRPTPVPNASTFDRILVMPPSIPPRVAAPPATAAAAPQPFTPPQLPVAEDVEDEPAGQPGGVPNPRGGPVFPGFAPGQFPGGQVPAGSLPQRGPIFPPPQQVPMPVPGAAQPMPGSTPTSTPAVVPGGMPLGVSTPGMVVQPPVQPGQPGQPGPGAAEPAR